MKVKVTYTITTMKQELLATDTIDVPNASKTALAIKLSQFVHNIDPRFTVSKIVAAVYDPAC